MVERVAFLGLGVMGFPMAGHLHRAGHATTVWNRSPERSARFAAAHPAAIVAAPEPWTPGPAVPEALGVM